MLPINSVCFMKIPTDVSAPDRKNGKGTDDYKTTLTFELDLFMKQATSAAVVSSKLKVFLTLSNAANLKHKHI